MEAIVARPEVPIEDRQIHELLIGLDEGIFRVFRGEQATTQVGALQPLPERLADRLLVIDDEDGLLGSVNFRHDGNLDSSGMSEPQPYSPRTTPREMPRA